MWGIREREIGKKTEGEKGPSRGLLSLGEVADTSSLPTIFPADLAPCHES